MYYKITLSKVFFAMAEEDPSKDIEKLDLSDFPSGAECSVVDTETELGYEISFDIDLNTSDTKESAFLPYWDEDNRLFIPLLIGSYQEEIFDPIKEEPDEADAIAAAILNDAKCRFFIDKDIAGQVTSAYFKGLTAEEDIFEIRLYDYGKVYAVEVPILFFSMNDRYDFSTLILE